MSAASSPAPEESSYGSAGGGEASFLPNPASFIGSFVNFMFEEGKRPSKDPVTVRGPDLHQRMPVWMETKDVDIQGRPLSETELEDAGRWRGKYKKELEIADAIVKVKSQRIKELDHDVLGAYRQVKRWLGMEPPLSEAYAKAEAEKAWQELQDRLEQEAAAASASQGHSAGALSQPARHPNDRAVKTAWTVLMTAASTGKPLAQVASEYRPRVDFYGIDAFLDHRLAFVWLWTKLGMFIGLAQGTARGAQAITTDVQYLRASGVGVLSVLNLSVLAGVVKWGGNLALLGSAFCFGDTLVGAARAAVLPAHEVAARPRTTAHYVGGLACAGATVGVMPWWILNDAALALRLSLSGVCVGGALGVVVGVLMSRMVALNLSMLDATPRQLRRYEALLLRQREWVEAEVVTAKKNSPVWW